MKQDIYKQVTDKIIADLEKGQLTWLKPWSTGNLDGRIVKPLRHNGMPYNGINVLMLWAASVEAGYVSPHWMTFKQAKELGANVRKGERGSLVVYANSITKTEEQDDGTEEERKIPFMKGYSVLTSIRSKVCPSNTTPSQNPSSMVQSGSRMQMHSLRQLVPICAMVAIVPVIVVGLIMCRCQPLKASAALRPIMQPLPMS